MTFLSSWVVSFRFLLSCFPRAYACASAHNLIDKSTGRSVFPTCPLLHDQEPGRCSNRSPEMVRQRSWIRQTTADHWKSRQEVVLKRHSGLLHQPSSWV